MPDDNVLDAYHRLIAELDATVRAHQFARTARLILRINETKAWKKLGYKNWADFAEKGLGHGLKESSVYLHLRAANRMGNLSDADLDELGISKCRELCLLVPPGESLDPKWVDEAKRVSLKQLQMSVRERIASTGGPIEFGPYFNPPFRGLQHEPSNEQGVVFLFGIVARDLGFVVEAIRRGYPDCVAKQRLATTEERWRRVYIEFEYVSSNFDHPLSGPSPADLIVCWENDLKENAPLPVLELRSKIRELDASKR